MNRTARRAATTALGVLASRVVPSLPDQVHPVARFGAFMTEVEETLRRIDPADGDDRRTGVVHLAIGTLAGLLAGRAAPTPIAVVALSAAGPQLRRVAAEVADVVRDGDLVAARATLPWLVGRDPSGLDASGIAAAAIESVAENMVDAVFAPAWWGLVAGAPGVGAHRAVNTMDAMVGHHTPRHERYGWASARADDLAAWIPARLFALAVAVARPDRARVVLATVRRDAPAHPSPNAGVAEAAVAAALGVTLGGPLAYGDRREDRPTLGDGPRPAVADLDAAITLARRTEDLLVLSLAGIAVVAGLVGTVRR